MFKHFFITNLFRALSILVNTFSIDNAYKLHKKQLTAKLKIINEHINFCFNIHVTDNLNTKTNTTDLHNQIYITDL